VEVEEYQRNYQLEQTYWWFVGVRAMVERLLSLSGEGTALGRVLDIGCGTGALLELLKGRSREAWGIDNSQQALQFCRKRGLTNLVLADATQLPFDSDYFDLVTAIGIIEHVQDDQALLDQIWRVLKPRGAVVLLTSSFPYLWSMHDTANNHRRRYYLRPLRRRIEQIGFETLRFSHLNFFLFPLLAPALMGHRLLFGTRSAHPRRIMPTPPRPVNAWLTSVLRLEARLMGHLTFPWGVSMIGAFRKGPRSAPGAP
jgi:ubiquinone/menaquinone biosynthesis C-methylase UbiE